jgi:hypothetical protein
MMNVNFLLQWKTNDFWGITAANERDCCGPLLLIKELRIFCDDDDSFDKSMVLKTSSR